MSDGDTPAKTWKDSIYLVISVIVYVLLLIYGIFDSGRNSYRKIK